MKKSNSRVDRENRQRNFFSANALTHEEARSLVAILPEQLFTAAQNSYIIWTGERLLMLAVLQDAFHSYLKYCNARARRGRKFFEETRTWFWSHERHWLYAFEPICEHLHLDPDYIRRGLEQGLQSDELHPVPKRLESRRPHGASMRKMFARAA
jgi:hypothetical protein